MPDIDRLRLETAQRIAADIAENASDWAGARARVLDDLRATPYHTVRDPEFFRTMKGITVRNQTRALAIDRAA